MNTIIAIDPGSSNGGIAVYSGGIVEAVRVPDTPIKLQEYLLEKKKMYENITVFIEKVQPFVSDSDQKGKRFRIQKLLANYRELVTVIQLCRIKYVEVPPITWQTTLELKWKPKPEQQERKRRYKRYAQRCFPSLNKVTLYTADALCIVQFALVKIDEDINWIRSRLK